MSRARRQAFSLLIFMAVVILLSVGLILSVASQVEANCLGSLCGC